MKSMAKLIRRFVGILLLSGIILITLNIVILMIIASQQTANIAPWTMADEAASALQKTKTGYELPAETREKLEQENAWAIYIDNATSEVKWHTENTPDTVPKKYTISDIASLTRGYIDGYPTYTGESEDGLVVVAYPQDRFWKHLTPSWDFNFIKNSPKMILVVFGLNALCIFMIYMVANSKLLKSVNPIVNGIQDLPTGEPIYLKAYGPLSELADHINQTSEILQEQTRKLEKREIVRANWISGISHDIRTPLSMVMGYAGQMEENDQLPEIDRKKAGIIRQQSIRMKNLINDLNLAAKLEYNTQPMKIESVNVIAIARQSVVDFINYDISKKYSIKWMTEDNLQVCLINGDKELLGRALENIISNAQIHNPDGCDISVSVKAIDGECEIRVEDNGVGMSDEALEKLHTTPHYIMNDSGITEPRHGLGLLIVQKIVAAHHGTVRFEHGKHGGFAVILIFPEIETGKKIVC